MSQHDIDRFWSHVHRGTPEECWPWTASKLRGGYGAFSRSRPRKTIVAHRFAYEITAGPIPDGFHVDHLCRNVACVNPFHLEAVTPRENVLRGDTPAARNAAKTHCPQGHEYTPENTYAWKPGMRRCRTCNRERERIRAQALRAALSALDGDAS